MAASQSPQRLACAPELTHEECDGDGGGGVDGVGRGQAHAVVLDELVGKGALVEQVHSAHGGTPYPVSVLKSRCGSAVL